MFEQYHYPKIHDPKRIDELLAMGWYRMGQSMFTNKYVVFHNRVYRTVWLRNRLKDYERTNTFKNLQRRNKSFRIELKKVNIDHQHEDLFTLYKNAMTFDPVDTIHQLLNAHSAYGVQVFNTYEINLYDKDNLIGCSYFDVGEKSAEGISSFYNPSYQSHSIGKYLIYLQIETCLANKLDYFYPGYFVPGYPHLDYKLNIGSTCLEFFNNDDMNWYDILEYKHESIPMDLQQYFF
jgi:arginyl-tRNA--protein-N-Asp/Glu arginylyltransferase